MLARVDGGSKLEGAMKEVPARAPNNCSQAKWAGLSRLVVWVIYIAAGVTYALIGIRVRLRVRVCMCGGV